MNYDMRFALIDREGKRRYAQLIAGTFQVGKGRDETPVSIEAFARLILVEGKSGRFTRADGSKQGVLGFNSNCREAVAFELDPAIAARIGKAPSGRKPT